MLKIWTGIAKYLAAIYKSLYLIHIGTFNMQIKASIVAGSLLMPWYTIIEKITHWGLLNQDYLLFTFGAIGVDYVLGTIKHIFIDRDFNLKENAKKVVLKASLVMLVGFLFEGIPVILKSDSLLAEYFTNTLRLIVFLYPAGSALGNSSVLTNGVFPPSIVIDKFSKFQKNLSLNSLTDKINDDERTGSN